MLCLACAMPSGGPLCERCRLGLRAAPEVTVGDGITGMAGYVHEGPARALVHALKYRGVIAAAGPLAEAMADRVPAGITALVPVPRARIRVLRYGVDPAVVLARAVSERTGIPVVGGLSSRWWWRRHAGRSRGDRGAVRLSPGPVRKGDLLILTKPLGTGILSSALKRGLIDDGVRIKMTNVMKTLNKTAAELMMNYDVHSCTDVTGFGLMGHLKEMSTGSKCNARIYFDKLPFIEKTEEMATAGVVPAGTHNNLDFVSKIVDFGNLSKTQQLLACDAQTAGGLLVALPEADAHKYLKELHENEVNDAVIIGEFVEEGEGRIFVSN